MTIDSKPDGDDLTQFVCSGVNFDIDEKPVSRKRRSKLDGAQPRVGFGSLRSRAEADKPARPPRKKRVRKKDDASMSSLYSYEDEGFSPITGSRPVQKHKLLCTNCDEPHDVAHLLHTLDPHIEQIVKHRVEARESELRQELVAEFQRRKIASEQR